MSAGSWWVRKDLQRIRSPWAQHCGEFTAAELGYLRTWSLVLLSSDLEMDDDDRERLRWVVRTIDCYDEHAGVR